jgi:hypothetical protein
MASFGDGIKFDAGKASNLGCLGCSVIIILGMMVVGLTGTVIYLLCR